MAIKEAFFILGVVLLILKLLKFLIVPIGWIVFCFVIWFILFYVSTHNKNKAARTPKPVYLTQ